MTQNINHLAEPRLRAKRFNRVKRVEYIQWLCDLASVPVDAVVSRLSTRMQIDNYIEAMIDKPEWVEAAEEILIKEPDEEVIVEEVVEEVVEEDLTDAPFDINTNYDSMTVRELQDICRERGLTIRGTKAEVVLRLRRNDEGIEEETVEPDISETEAPLEEAAEETLDTPAEEAAVTEEVTTDAESSEQEENIDE
tara:strand:+ start:1222 stop:1806 length:585 start_codon:yes stop_codon:yes gene_type:complete